MPILSASPAPSLETDSPAAAAMEPEIWLKRFKTVFLHCMADPDCTAEVLAQRMHTSRTVLYRRVKSWSGLTLREFCENLRLERARELLESGEKFKIRALALRVGYRDALRFSRKFRARYGMYPSECLSRKQEHV